ncbi:MAG: hypothetical protein AB7I30_16400 [Isosphaeraceae bacterium]
MKPSDELFQEPSFPTPADRLVGLDRLWEATRPVQPSAMAWDALWADVRDRLDSSTEQMTGLRLVPATVESRPAVAIGRSWSLTALGLAQAAALLLGATLLLLQGPASRDLDTGTTPALVRSPATPALPVASVEIGAGQVILIHSQSQNAELKVVELNVASSNDRLDALDEQFVMLGAAESLAQGGSVW